MANTRLLAALLGPALFAARPAEAHIVSSRLGDLYGGALHPLTGLQDVILWLALGLLAGSQDLRQARWLVVIFPAGLATGLMAGVAGGVTNVAAALDAAFMCVLGGLVAGAVRMPGPVVLLIGLALAVMRGMANASGADAGADLFLFDTGLAAAGYAVITLTMAAAASLWRSDAAWQGIAVRACGSWIAAIGLMFGGYAVVGR